MVESELKELLENICAKKCEDSIIEVKSAHKGCPEKLYDTLSAFSNQDSGGTLIFGIDESEDFAKVGVYDAQDLQKKVMEYGEQMTPVVRPVFTVYKEDNKVFVSAEIPPIDISERPCFKTAKGRLSGSYIRVGDADKPMTEYEVYSYEAFRKKYRDDIREIEGTDIYSLDQSKVYDYVERRKKNRPHLNTLPKDQLYELTGVLKNGKATLSSIMLFSPYPQAYFPQLGVIATSVPGTEMGILDEEGRRFVDSRRIEGSLPEMLEACLAFVRNNMHTATVIDPKTGKRRDIPQYPMDAVREAVLNALVHRDYSIHTEGMPIQLTMYIDRIEISNPGGLYGRMTVDQLGHIQPDTRNPILVTAMEVLGQTENRYSGIPRIRHAMKELSLPEPVFIERRGGFMVILYNRSSITGEKIQEKPIISTVNRDKISDPKNLLIFCKIPRSRKEIVEFLAIPSAQYALRKYLDPLIEIGAIHMEIPDKPKSSKQRYVADFV